MNKLVKGAIAGAAGVVLLMGGAGSLAYWNDTANVGPVAGVNSITAGNLKVTAVTAGAWTKGFYNAGGTLVGSVAAVSPLSSVAIVPGNRLVYTQTFNIDAAGQDLWFTIASTNGAVSAASAAAVDVALATQINASANSGIVVGAVSGGNVIVSSGSGPGTIYKVNASAGPSTITVTWTVDFPFGASAVNTAKLGLVNLSQGSITLTQVAAP